jgi:hypothetical protein
VPQPRRGLLHLFPTLPIDRTLPSLFLSSAMLRDVPFSPLTGLSPLYMFLQATCVCMTRTCTKGS